MRRNPTRRLMAFVLSLLMLVGCFVPAFAADETGASSLGTTTLKDISESLNAISYATYQEKHPDAVCGVDVAVDIAAYIADATTADVELRGSVTDADGDTRENCLYVGDSGKVTWPVSIPMTGLYGYCTVLRSMTGGRGVYEYEFVRYEQCPSDVQEKEVAARASKLTDESAE